MSEVKLEKFLEFLRSQGLLKNTAPDNMEIIKQYANHATAGQHKRVLPGYEGFTQGSKKTDPTSR